MPQNYTIVQLPGKSKFRIATTDTNLPNEAEAEGVKSPEWMVKMDDILTCDVADFNDHAELFGWYAESSRFTTGDISNSLFTSATLKHSDLIVLIPNAGYSAVLETRMNTGTQIDELTIVRLGNVKALKVKLQTIVYKNCRLQTYQQQLDRLILQMSVKSKENTIFVYNQLGENQGQMVSKVDYSQNTAE